MANMYEHETSMTIYYHKSNGDIHSYCTGISDMSMFGEHADDYAMILDYIVVEKDVMLLEFLYKFYVDVNDKKIKLKSDYAGLSKYL